MTTTRQVWALIFSFLGAETFLISPVAIEKPVDNANIDKLIYGRDRTRPNKGWGKKNSFRSYDVIKTFAELIIWLNLMKILFWIHTLSKNEYFSWFDIAIALQSQW